MVFVVICGFFCVPCAAVDVRTKGAPGAPQGEGADKVGHIFKNCFLFHYANIRVLNTFLE